jgi:hypothetical protein
MGLAVEKAFLERRKTRMRRFQHGCTGRRDVSIAVVVGSSQERENVQTKEVATDAVFGRCAMRCCFGECLAVVLAYRAWIIYSILRSFRATIFLRSLVPYFVPRARMSLSLLYYGSRLPTTSARTIATAQPKFFDA